MRRFLASLFLLVFFAVPAGAGVSQVNGWTVITESVDTLKIYVSNSTGNNGTAVDGDISKPYQTLAAGMARLRADKPDWLLLKKGDTWTDQNLGQLEVTGRSADEPMLIGTYGSGARPIIKTGADISALVFQGSSVGGKYQAVIGIDFYAYTRNPDDQGYIGAGDSSYAIRHLVDTEWFLVEDCVTRFYPTNMSFELVAKPEVKLRRNVITDSYGVAGVYHSSGVFFSQVESPVVEENVFDHNGWHADLAGGGADGDATIFNHNIYIENNNGPATITGNIFANASGNGVQARSAGTAYNNLFVRNSIGLLLGSAAPLAHHLTATYNVITESKDITVALERGWGIDVNGTDGVQVVQNNIITQTATAGSTGGAITLNADTSNITASNNIIFDWNVGITDNGVGNTITPNQIDLNGLDEEGYDFPDPTRTVGSYHGTIGGTATLVAFMAEARLQSKDNWRPQYTANAVNNYIRAGFGLPAINDSSSVIRLRLQ